MVKQIKKTQQITYGINIYSIIIPINIYTHLYKYKLTNVIRYATYSADNHTQDDDNIQYLFPTVFSPLSFSDR